MTVVLLIVLLLVTIAMVGVILMQRSEGGALGIGGGPGGMMSGRSAANLLTRTTMILGIAFMGICILLAVLSGASSTSGSVADDLSQGNDSGLPFDPDSLNDLGGEDDAPAEVPGDEPVTEDEPEVPGR